jgi:uncharacterized protein YjbI with pentapeptide repeats
MIEIKHHITGDVLHTLDAESLRGANLRWADLSMADLRGAKIFSSQMADVFNALRVEVMP